MENPRFRGTGTAVLPNVHAYSDDTTLLEAKTSQVPKPPVVWPWIAVVILLSITALSLVFALIIGANKTVPTPTASESQSSFGTVPPAPSTSPSASPTAVTVLTTDVVGKNVYEVTSYLISLGLQPVTSAGTEVPADDPRLMTVYLANPLGTLAPGTVVTVTYYVQQTDNTSPTPTPSQ